jgi:hypothetical protein
MKRVPAELALLALRQSGYQIKAATLRAWVHRGHITRGSGGYDLVEILTYLDRRAAAGRPEDRPPDDHSPDAA